MDGAQRDADTKDDQQEPSPSLTRTQTQPPPTQSQMPTQPLPILSPSLNGRDTSRPSLLGDGPSAPLLPLPLPATATTTTPTPASPPSTSPRSAEPPRPEDLLPEPHLLQNEWTFWYDKRQAPNRRVRGELESYESNLAALGSFRSVEDFWRIYNHLLKPTKIDNNANYHFFKKGIKPMWEDPANAKWVLTLKGDRGLLDTMWENLLLSLIGEQIDVGDDIAGAVLSRRKNGDRIALWNKGSDQDAIIALGRQMKALLPVDPPQTVEYLSHDDSMRTGASFGNPVRFTL